MPENNQNPAVYGGSIKRIIVSVLFVISMFVQCCNAATLGNSPDGNWTVESITQGSRPGVGIFDKTRHLALVIDTDTTGSKQVITEWSPDSTKVVLLDQAGAGSGIVGAWFDGGKWHASVEPDSDLNQAEALATSQGFRGPVKADQRTLAEWISPDAIRIRGTLRYTGGKELHYSYTLQVVPGSYPSNAGGFEIGGLKISNCAAEQ